MATTITDCSWRDKLNKLEFCKFLKENNGREYTKNIHNDSKSLICIHSSDLFIWDQSESQIITCNLKSLNGQIQNSQEGSTPLKQNTEKSISDLYKNKDEKSNSSYYQKLLVSSAVNLDVESLSVNRCGTHIALAGARGVKVVELPRRWGRNGCFEGGKDVISCRAIDIGDRNLSRNCSLRVRQVSWHTGSPTDSHVAVLASDNLFRVYSINDPDDPVTCMAVTPGHTPVGSSPNKTMVSSALGETAVAFDIGSPVSLSARSRPGQPSSNEPPVQVWPVYCVRGNGDLLILYSCLSSNRSLELPCVGPLVMHPPAEDNYGVDACAVLCLPTPLPVLLVATCEGRVHHCVQLPGHDLTDPSIQPEPPSPRWCHYEPPPEPVLFVVETAELELCLATQELDGLPDEEEDFMCPVKLRKDPVSSDRYYCQHAAGVHSVALPWVNLVQQYLMDDTGDFGLPEDKTCVVEHLVCTKPLHSCPLAPVLGLDVLSELSLGPHLLTLSSEYEFTTLPIGLQYRVSGPSGPEGPEAAGDTRVSTREPFSQVIAQLLQRRTSHPLLKCSSSTVLSQQEMFALLSRATQVLREEHMQRADLAHRTIHARVQLLRAHKDQQLQDLHALVQSRARMREAAHRGADRLEEAKDNQQALLTRLEAVLHKLQARSPTLSSAERGLARELARIQGNLKTYTQNLEHLRTKQSYQERQMAPSPSKADKLVLRDKQLTQIHGVLAEEAADIQELKADIQRLNISFS